MTRKALTLSALMLLSLFAASMWGQMCSINNYSDGPYPISPVDNTLHITGQHEFDATANGGCTYRGSMPNCGIHSGAGASGHVTDSGLTISTCHVGFNNVVNGASTTSGNVDAIAGAKAFGAVRTCFACGCFTGITINSQSSDGLTVSVSFPSDSIWNQEYDYSLDCGPPGSPIIIDTAGEGFHLTDRPGGVKFDFFASGTPVQIAWTAADSHNAWLVLDRNGNGKIDDATEMFGNLTPQPKSRNMNGYAALAVFDMPENGGNGDGVIDAKDAVFAKLRLWIDSNHDGISQPEELHTLPELGITSLALKYHTMRKTDAYGNTFRFRAKVNPEGQPAGDNVDRVSYDVFLLTQTN